MKHFKGKDGKYGVSVYPINNKSFKYEEKRLPDGSLQTFNFRPYEFISYQAFYFDKGQRTMKHFYDIEKLSKFVSLITGTNYQILSL
jgi:hypothetical protein